MAGAKLDEFPPGGDCQVGYSMVISANAFLRNVENLTVLAKQLAAFITTFTPVKPIDSVTHTVQFVVTYGVGIQPNWTLIQVAGPLAQLANAQGVRTHNLVIALGPEEENKANITNQAILSITR
jgi:hypothetical protein